MSSALQTQAYLRALEDNQSKASGYKSWGEVEILEMACRIDRDCYLHFRFGGEEILSEQRIFEKGDYLAAIFRKRKSTNCILITRQQNASKVVETIPPILDDQAQLLGPSLRYIRDASPNSITKALRGRYAINTGKGNTICIGRNIEEAYIAAQLVEKTSKAFLYARNIGGAKPINRLEAWVMHKFYMLKYSRIAESESDG